jgi:hypothetical protein
MSLVFPKIELILLLSVLARGGFYCDAIKLLTLGAEPPGKNLSLIG